MRDGNPGEDVGKFTPPPPAAVPLPRFAGEDKEGGSHQSSPCNGEGDHARHGGGATLHARSHAPDRDYLTKGSASRVSPNLRITSAISPNSFANGVS